MRLRTFGGLALEGRAFGRSKLLLVLAYLTVEGSTSRRELADLFWRDANDPRDSVSTALRRLSKAVGEGLVVEGDRIRSIVPSDIDEFREAVRAGADVGVAALYAGPFLQGIDVDLNMELEEWVFAHRERFANAARAARIHLALQARAAGDLPTAIGHAEDALDMREAQPLEFRQMVDVFRVLHGTRNVRMRELAAAAEESGVTVAELEDAALSLAGSGSASGRGLERILTSMRSPFIGRDRELEILADAFADPRTSLLTLHGPGGVGKSRLAHEAARRALDSGAFEGGVFVVGMDALTSSGQVPVAVADALGLPLVPQVPAVDQIVQAIGAARTLMILDNAEHLLPLTTFLTALLDGCDGLVVMVTSRVRLNLEPERVLTLSGLPLGDVDMDRSDALLLFEAHARRGDLGAATAEYDVASVRRVCELVEGFPLGIELAATWVHVLPPDQIALEMERSLEFLASAMRDAASRHESLRVVVQHSWDLLSDDARNALRRLAAFRGGFTREAARVVAEVGVAALRELVDASLVRVDPDGRFERHPLVFDVSREQLEQNAAEATAVKDAHARYYLDLLIDQHDALLGGPELPRAAEVVDRNLPNIQDAVSWAAQRSLDDGVPLACLALVFFGEMRGRYGSVVEIVAPIADRPAAPNDQPAAQLARLAARACRAYSEFRLGNVASADRECAEVTSELDGRRDRGADLAMFMAAVAGANCSLVAGAFGDATRRIDLALDAAARERARARLPSEVKRGDVMAGAAHEIRGMIATIVQDFDVATHHLVQGEGLLRRQQSPLLCNILWHLGQVELAGGRLERSVDYLAEGLALSRGMGYRTMEAYIAGELARAMFELGSLDRAEELANQSLELAEALHVRDLSVHARRQLGLVASARERFSTALSHYTEAVEEALLANSAYLVPDILVGASEALARVGDREGAIDLLAYLIAQEDIGDTMRHRAHEELRRRVAAGGASELDVDVADLGRGGVRWNSIEDVAKFLARATAKLYSRL